MREVVTGVGLEVAGTRANGGRNGTRFSWVRRPFAEDRRGDYTQVCYARVRGKGEGNVVVWRGSTFGAKVTSTVERTDSSRQREKGKRTESPE